MRGINDIIDMDRYLYQENSAEKRHQLSQEIELAIKEMMRVRDIIVSPGDRSIILAPDLSIELLAVLPLACDEIPTGVLRLHVEEWYVYQNGKIIGSVTYGEKAGLHEDTHVVNVGYVTNFKSMIDKE